MCAKAWSSIPCSIENGMFLCSSASTGGADPPSLLTTSSAAGSACCHLGSRPRDVPQMKAGEALLLLGAQARKGLRQGKEAKFA